MDLAVKKKMRNFVVDIKLNKVLIVYFNIRAHFVCAV